MEQPVKILGPDFSTFVRSVMIACEEKGISYEYGMEIDGQAVNLADETHCKYHPYGKLPAVIMGQRSLCETAAILRYLDTEYPQPALQPGDSFARAKVDQWCSLISLYIDQAIVRKFLLEFVFPKGEDGQVRMDKVEQALPDVQRALTILSDQLAEGDYICGDDFSIADILLAPMLDYLAKHPMGAELLASTPNLNVYIERLRERPSCRKVLL